MSTTNQTPNLDSNVEIIEETSVIESISRAEIDIQIATAKRYPRQLSKVKADMMSFATLDEETAAACFYSLPRAGKTIQGPSVRLAEIAVSCYGNIRAGSRVISAVTNGDNPHVVIQAVAHDLERNVSVTIEKRRRITAKKDFKTGIRKPVDEDDINLAANAGAAIAFRDAVFKVVPMALVKPCVDMAKKVAIGDAKTLADRRAKAVEMFAKMGVIKDRVLAKLGKRSIEDIDLSDLEELIGIHTAIKEGDLSIDEAFAEQAKPEANAVPSFDKPTTPAAPVAPASATAPEPAKTIDTPATTPPVAQAAKRTRAPKPESATTPTPEPTPEPKPTPPDAPIESHPEVLIDSLVELLHDNQVTADDFLSWIATTGRDRKFNIDANAVEAISELPFQLVKSLLDDPTGLAKCIKIYGNKAQ